MYKVTNVRLFFFINIEDNHRCVHEGGIDIYIILDSKHFYILHQKSEASFNLIVQI